MLTEKNMLTAPTRITPLSRDQSFESPPCPPYNLSQEDVLAQAPPPEQDELWAELERIEDARALKQKFYDEHQLMKEQLHMAGRFGLELQQNLEHAQRAERQSLAQLQALQDENTALQSRVHQQALHFNTHLDGSEDDMKNLTSENESLQKELDGCRRELKMFRKELDGLVEQMNEMGTEVLDAKTKVTVYSRRLNEVEQELTVTQGLNVDLQEQLRVTLERQKQTHSSTAMAMKNMQSELGKVLSDSGTIRSTLEELENRQDKCEGKVVEMMSNTKEYAHLLEEAQTTIQTMRIESDMEGRAWLPLASPSGRFKSTGQLSTLAMENPELDNVHDFPQGSENGNDDAPQGTSLGMELGLGVSFPQPKEDALSSPPPTPAAATPSAPFPYPEPLTPATSPQVPMASQSEQLAQPRPTTKSPEPIKLVQQPTPVTDKAGSKPSKPAPPPITTELQQRLEEHNILQTVLNSSLPSSRPQWNPSVSLEYVPPPSLPSQGRSRSSSRAATNASLSSSRCSSRSVSQMSLHRHPTSVSTSPGSSVRVGQGPTQRQQSSSVLASLQASASPRSKSSPGSTSSLMDAIAAHSGKRNQTSAMSVGSDSRKGTPAGQNRPRRSTTAMTVEKNPNPNAGLKYLLKGSSSSSGIHSSNGSPTAVSNVMTKAKGTANNNNNNNRDTSPSSKAANPAPMRGSRTP
ncbi:hypothetical protein EC968_008628 [Mortierella alpina]|nr:hypothetical protein EC968_008628 [Mortierella alpina]